MATLDAALNPVRTEPSLYHRIHTALPHFHGRVVKTFTPLPENNRLYEVVKRIVILIAALFIYPLWGLIRLADKLRGTQENTINQVTPNVELNQQIQQKLAHDLRQWHLGAFTGDRLVVFAGREIQDASGHNDGIGPQLIDNTPQAFKDLVEQTIQYCQVTMGKYKSDSRIVIEFLVVSKLQRAGDVETVEFQSFRQAYRGLEGTGHIGMRTEEIKDQFMQDASNAFELIKVASVWDSNGNFIYR